ncbi:hypothetical protein [Paramicrobacterium agarici]|uniref:Uncharacterized protein n=1 Tax=Paramicrobacterium agarici TaxID=630514 RepID=A0A2A9DWA5_9MICO|nr:hypothetical protein [Microbacterium agarici]PFG30883.1 hypothetical protein ATJ78_1825 [Microbacterium agarici]
MSLPEPSGSDRARVAGLRATSQAALGTARLGVGPGFAGAVIVVYSLIRFVSNLGSYPNLPVNVGTWVLFLATLGAVVWHVRHRGYHLTARSFWIASIPLALVAIVDVAGVWGETNSGTFPTAACAIGGVLIGALSLRPIGEIVVCTGVLTLILIAGIASSEHARAASFGAELVMLAIAIVPPFIGSLSMNAYRSLSRKALDRVMIQSTVTAPAFGPELLASERLATVDHEVEVIFDRVASGELELPLSPDVAEHAAALATELRGYLASGRQNTWLHHAVIESGVLRGSLDLDDPHATAALLLPAQREGLLSSLWLLALSSEGPALRTRVRIGEVYTVQRETGPERRCHIQIVVDDLKRHRIEPAAWAALRSVGTLVHTQTPGATRFALECAIDPGQ